MTYYWTCPFCGANLDPCERCDCDHLISVTEIILEEDTE